MNNFQIKIKCLIFKSQKKNKKFMKLEMKNNRIKLLFLVKIILSNTLLINMIIILFREY